MTKKLWKSDELYAAIMAVLFVSSEPLSLSSVADLLQIDVHSLLQAVEQHQPDDSTAGVLVQHTGEDMQLVTNPRYAEWVKVAIEDDTKRELTPAAKESLAIIAYRQPVCRSDIEKIRGLDCRKILDNLVKKGLIQISKYKDETDLRSNYYEVSLGFLEYFGLSSTDDLVVHLSKKS